jgi:hypothetical protein
MLTVELIKLLLFIRVTHRYITCVIFSAGQIENCQKSTSTQTKRTVVEKGYGKSNTQLAKAHGIGRTQVQNIMKRYVLRPILNYGHKSPVPMVIAIHSKMLLFSMK